MGLGRVVLSMKNFTSTDFTNAKRALTLKMTRIWLIRLFLNFNGTPQLDFIWKTEYRGVRLGVILIQLDKLSQFGFYIGNTRMVLAGELILRICMSVKVRL